MPRSSQLLLITLLVLAARLPGAHRGLAAFSRPPSDVASELGIFRAPEFRYHSHDEIEELMAEWCRADPRRVRPFALPASAGGRVPAAIQFGADAPGAAPLEERATVFLLGALDGASRAGSEAVLHAAHGLASRLDRLRADVAIVAVPAASPDGLARAALPLGGATGRDDSEVDDDGDGRSGEDPGDDLDGDGEVLELAIEDAGGAWTFGPDRRFLVPAGRGAALRLRRAIEGRDDDGDGLWNEDGPGGVDLDRHFPAGWKGPGADGAAGRFPLADPLARALADAMLERRTALVLVFQGRHGGVARPGGTLASDLDAAGDEGVAAHLADVLARATGRRFVAPLPLAAAHGGEHRGALVDWVHAALRVPAAEIAVWGPLAVGRDGRALDFRAGRAEAARSADGARGAHAFADDEQIRWARWLDEARGGLDFAPWRPVELGIGRRAWVGGWRGRADLDPPEDCLAAALEGIAVFSAEVVEGLPRLEVTGVRVERFGDLVRLRARVVNRGAFPTRLSSGGASRGGAASAREVRVRLDAPAAGGLLAGEATRELGVIGPNGSGPELDWLVLAPEGTTLTLHATGGLGAGARREVRP